MTLDPCPSGVSCNGYRLSVLRVRLRRIRRGLGSHPPGHGDYIHALRRWRARRLHPWPVFRQPAGDGSRFLSSGPSRFLGVDETPAFAYWYLNSMGGLAYVLSQFRA